MTRWLLALAAIAACEKQPASTAEPPVIIVTKSEINYLGREGEFKRPRSTSRQLILGITDDWTSTRATLQMWSRDDGGGWQAVGAPWPAVVGRTGTAWGTGIRPAPTDGDGPRKHEGDGKSPAGMFRIRGAYGYAATATTKLPYAQSGPLECVNDASSTYYTQIVDRNMTVDGNLRRRDWKSSEDMKRDDALYTWVIDLAHNPAATPGGGSCIFFHVWGGPDTTTAGCTAMDEAKLVELLQQLDPAAEPIYVLLPRREYKTLAAAWDLP